MSSTFNAAIAQLLPLSSERLLITLSQATRITYPQSIKGLGHWGLDEEFRSMLEPLKTNLSESVIVTLFVYHLFKKLGRPYKGQKATTEYLARQRALSPYDRFLIDKAIDAFVESLPEGFVSPFVVTKKVEPMHFMRCGLADALLSF